MQLYQYKIAIAGGVKNNGLNYYKFFRQSK